MVKFVPKSLVTEDSGLVDEEVDALKNTGKKSVATRRRMMRTRMWPEISDDALWLRQKSVGFTTIPRTLPIINKILDKRAGKGFPVAATYLALWCRVFDEGFVEIRNQRDLALESGFSGPRAEATWKSRMRLLVDLGVIGAKPGVRGDFQYVIMLNPLHVIAKMHENAQDDFDYRTLIDRMQQVGAEDISY